jgi:hypothetical protein
MLPQRPILSFVSRNHQFNCELILYMRGKAVGLFLKGTKSTKIQDLLKVSCDTLRSTFTFD